MKDRPPMLRRTRGDEDLEMNLPPGKTCADCRHCQRCCAIFGHIPADEVCDWHPSRFAPSAAELEYRSWFSGEFPLY